MRKHSFILGTITASPAGVATTAETPAIVAISEPTRQTEREGGGGEGEEERARPFLRRYARNVVFFVRETGTHCSYQQKHLSPGTSSGDRPIFRVDDAERTREKQATRRERRKNTRRARATKGEARPGRFVSRRANAAPSGGSTTTSGHPLGGTTAWASLLRKAGDACGEAARKGAATKPTPLRSRRRIANGLYTLSIY